MTSIQIDGTKISFESISLSQNIHGHHKAWIECSAKQLGQEDNVIGGEDTSKLIGKEVVMKMKDKRGTEGEINFVGLVSGIALHKHHRSYDRVSLSVISKTVLADSAFNSATYSEKSLGDIAKAILQPLGKLSIDMKQDLEIPYVCQYRETAFDFISRMASKHGHWFYYDGQKMNLGKYQQEQSIKMKLGPNVGSYHLSLSLLPLSGSLVHYNYEADEKYEVSSFDAPSPKLDRFGQVVYDASKETLSEDSFTASIADFTQERELKEFVNTRLGNKAAKLCQLHGDSEDGRIRIGTSIDLVDRQDNSIGTYVVIEVDHECDAGHNYSNYFKAIPTTIDIPSYNSSLKIPKCENQIAVVKENNDPDALGRVRVQFPWQDQNEKTPWIRVTSPYAGSGDLYFVPEVKDQVMVGFEFNHPDRPYVIGSLYHGKSKPYFFTEENTTKAIRTKCGHSIMFEDGDDSQITIVTKDEKHSVVLTLAEGGAINITTAGTMNLEAKEMNLMADNLNIEASQNLNLKGADVNIEADQGATIKATNAKMEGSAEVALKGTQAKVEGDATTTIKGGMVQIN